MTAHLLHAPSGRGHSFVPKKILNFALAQQSAAMEAAGVPVRVHNGALDGPVDAEELVGQLAPGDWLVLPLLDAVACGETLALAAALQPRTEVRVVATSFLASFCAEEIQVRFPGIQLLEGEIEVALPKLVQSGDLTPRSRAAPVEPERWPSPGSRARWGRYAALETSRGCAHFCSFCSANFLADPKGRPGWRALPADILRDWIDDQRVEGARFVELVDADFLGTNAAGLHRARELVRSGGLGVDVMAATRADSIVDNEDLIHDLRDVGFRKWQVGVESADQATLDRYHKQLRPETSLAAVRKLHEIGCELRLEFIMFEPWSTLETLRLNLDLLAELSSLGVSIQRALFNRMRIGRWNRRGFRRLEREGRLVRHIFPLYDYVDYDPAVGQVFRTLQAAMGRSAGQACTRYLLLERLADVGALARGVVQGHMAALDRILWELVRSVVVDAPAVKKVERYAEEVNAEAVRWLDATRSLVGPEAVIGAFPTRARRPHP